MEFRVAPRRQTHLSEALIEVKLAFRFVPILLTAVIITIEMPAAINPYSMAVAPDSSRRKPNKIRFNTASSFQQAVVPRAGT